MEGRGANLNIVRQQAASKSKARITPRSIQDSIVPSPVVPQDQQIISNGAIIIEPSSNPPPTITTPQELRNVLSPMSSVGIDNINPEPEDPESGKFLASLIAQGAAGFGAGIMGGSSQDILRSTGMFDRMRESDINRQDRLRQNELLRDERLGEKKEKQAEIKKREEQAKRFTDPKSEESINRRQVYKSLGYDISEDLSYADLENQVVIQSLRDKLQEKKLAAMPRGGIGVGQIKEEKRKDPTEAERLSLGFAKRTESSNKMLNNLEDKFLNKEGGFSPSSQFGYAPERFKSSERKNYEAAQKDFIGAVLRKESGASISDEEFQREAEKFFPLAGDDQENIQFKQLLRKQAINNLKTSANIRYVKDNQTGETVEIDPFGNVLRRYKE